MPDQRCLRICRCREQPKRQEDCRTSNVHWAETPGAHPTISRHIPVYPGISRILFFVRGHPVARPRSRVSEVHPGCGSYSVHLAPLGYTIVNTVSQFLSASRVEYGRPVPIAGRDRSALLEHQHHRLRRPRVTRSCSIPPARDARAPTSGAPRRSASRSRRWGVFCRRAR